MIEPDFTNPMPSFSLVLPRIKQEYDFYPIGNERHLPQIMQIDPSKWTEKWTSDSAGGRKQSVVENSSRGSRIPELAELWPVYVSNFRCPEVADRDQAIRSYFSKQGLKVCWWFSRMDEYYFGFQLTAGLYDMLVYFGSEAEAQKAIEKCHLKRCLGFRMNVLPGRKPVFFAKDRSVYVRHMENGHDFSEEYFERHMKRLGYVRFVVKFDMYSGAAEMNSPQDVERVRLRASEAPWPLEPVVADIRKQRYLECDVLELIEMYLSTNLHELKKPKPSFRYLPLKGSGEVKPSSSPGQPPTEAELLLEKNVNKIRKKIEKDLDNGKQPRSPS